jgi:hypothetical protein
VELEMKMFNVARVSWWVERDVPLPPQPHDQSEDRKHDNGSLDGERKNEPERPSEKREDVPQKPEWKPER